MHEQEISLKNGAHHNGHRKSGRFHVLRRRVADASKWSFGKKIRWIRQNSGRAPRGRWQKLMMITTASLDAATLMLLLLTAVLLFGILLDYYHLV